MKSLPLLKKTMLSAAIGALCASNTVNAGAFSLYTEGSGAAIGNFAAGIAAEASSAVTGWYNPAGLPFLGDEQVVLSGIGVFPNSPIRGNSTYSSIALPIPPYVQTFNDLDGAKNAFVPAVHYALPLGNRAAFGLSIISPFGLSTEYTNSSPVRYSSTLSELFLVDVSPELGGKLTDNLAIGVGFDFQYSKVKFNRIVGTPALLQPTMLPIDYNDTNSYNEGDSVGFGFHAGLLAQFNEGHTRLGLNYQSKVKHRYSGHSVFTGRLAGNPLEPDPTATLRSDALYSNQIEFPDIVTLSAYHDVTKRVALLGSVVYTGWDVFKTIELNNVAAVTPTGPGFVDSVSTSNYRNAWRFAVGANVKANDKWMLRVGAGYDETPTIDSERDARLPDADRWALSAGAHYEMNSDFAFDIGYTYLFANDDTLINKTEAIGTSAAFNVNARGKPHASLVGAQLTWYMDKKASVPTK